MRKKKVIKNTMNSQVYNKAIRANLGCPICPPNKGCNGDRDYGVKSWKDSRDNQWRN